MLTHVRTLGYVFNPVSFYYCFDGADERPRSGGGGDHEHALAVNGTPTCSTRAIKPTKARCCELDAFDKDFHVSPFNDMGHEYVWALQPSPGTALEVHMHQPRAAGQRRLPRRDLACAAQGAHRPAAWLVPDRCATRCCRSGSTLAIYWQAAAALAAAHDRSTRTPKTRASLQTGAATS